MSPPDRSLDLPVHARAASVAAAESSFWHTLAREFVQPRSPQLVVVVLALWITVAANWRLWSELARLGGAPSLYVPSMVAMGLVVLPGTVALLALTAWARGMKPVWLAVLLLSACVQHYMLSYRVVIDPTMVTNVLQTDVAEARDLLSARLLADVLLVLLPPALWLARVPVTRAPWRRQALRNLALLAAALAVLVTGSLAMYRELAPLMRNNPQLRYMVNPLATVYSVLRQGARPSSGVGRPLVAISAGAALGASYAAQSKPPLLLLVVGETARADHFALNGYARDTTPDLAARQVLSWRNAHSCGTSTAASVPCMFSHLGKGGFEARKAEHENLLDVLQAAGLAVLWVDNQAGCKGVCDRVAHASTQDARGSAEGRKLCDGDECLDSLMLAGLDERIAALPAERRARGVVVVLHQMGSHGPAYFKRSPTDRKPFMPECRTTELARCSQAELVNGFDNSIAYTDHFLGQAIDWLKSRRASEQNALLYMSDHGESLGEFGIYLHGMPYAFAPEVQKHVPLVLWPGTLVERTRVSVGCVAERLDAPTTHDNLYPTVLGLLDVRSPTYRPELDIMSPCRSAG